MKKVKRTEIRDGDTLPCDPDNIIYKREGTMNEYGVEKPKLAIWYTVNQNE